MLNNVMSYNGAISNRDGVVPGREKVRCGPIQTVIQRPHQICKISKLHVYLWNTGTMSGSASEFVKTRSRKRIGICCVQESLWKGYSARLISVKGFSANISSYGAETI